MTIENTAERSNFGLLPEPERGIRSVAMSLIVNGTILLVLFYIGANARKVLKPIDYHVELIVPLTPPPERAKPVVMARVAPTPPPPEMPEVKLDQPRIDMPKPKPEPGPIHIEAKANLPEVEPGPQQVVLAPQPKAVLLPTATQARSNNATPIPAAVPLAQRSGITSNPDAARVATISALGNQPGGTQGQPLAGRGAVGFTSISKGPDSGPGGAPMGNINGRVIPVNIPRVIMAAPIQNTPTVISDTGIELQSRPEAQYTNEARQMRIEGEVVLNVIFRADGEVRVVSVVHGLGHGLDEEARRVAQQIRFRPSCHNGHAVDTTKNVTITFQLA